MLTPLQVAQTLDVDALLALVATAEERAAARMDDLSLSSPDYVRNLQNILGVVARGASIRKTIAQIHATFTQASANNNPASQTGAPPSLDANALADIQLLNEFLAAPPDSSASLSPDPSDSSTPSEMSALSNPSDDSDDSHSSHDSHPPLPKIPDLFSALRPPCFGIFPVPPLGPKRPRAPKTPVIAEFPALPFGQAALARAIRSCPVIPWHNLTAFGIRTAHLAGHSFRPSRKNPASPNPENAIPPISPPSSIAPIPSITPITPPDTS